MADLHILVTRARQGDLSAFEQIVRRFQDMAVAYAFTHLHDLQSAEDAAQEAFLHAFLNLDRLRAPEAFTSWFRQVLFTRCDRINRRAENQVVSLNAIPDPPDGAPDPLQALESRSVREQVTAAIGRLPAGERQVVSLCHFGDMSRRDVASFLGISETQVKNRLQAARRRLREELWTMAREELSAHRPSSDDEFVAGVMEDVVTLTDRETEALLRRVDIEDCTVALSVASPAVRERLTSVMSERVRRFIAEDIDGRGPFPPEDVRRAQLRVVEVLRRLKRRSPSDDDAYAARKRSLLERLAAGPTSWMSLEDLADMLVGLAEIAREEGVLTLQDAEASLAEDGGDALLGYGLRHVIDCVGRDRTRDLLETRMATHLQQQEARCRLLIDGIVALAAGESPEELRERLANHCGVR